MSRDKLNGASVVIRGVPYYATTTAAEMAGVSTKRFRSLADSLGFEADGWSAFVNRADPLPLWSATQIQQVRQAAQRTD